MVKIILELASQLIVMSKANVICMIPARIGSQRFKEKNLALINGKPVLQHGIELAKDSQVFDNIIVNGDHEYFREIAKSLGVSFYERDATLASSLTKSDDVIMDFINKYSCNQLVWLNAIAPLQTTKDVIGFTDLLRSDVYQSLFAVKEEFVQTLYKGKPLNFSATEKFQRTQDLEPVQLFVPSIMGWNSEAFKESYRKNKHGLFCGQIGYYGVSKLSTLVIKTENDFRLIRSVIEGITSYNNEIGYYSA